MAENKKRCQCGDPKITQGLPEGFAGMVECGNCHNIIDVGAEKPSVYEGNDPVEAFLHTAMTSTGKPTFEQALIIMTQRMERAIASTEAAIKYLAVSCQEAIKSLSVLTETIEQANNAKAPKKEGKAG